MNNCNFLIDHKNIADQSDAIANLLKKIENLECKVSSVNSLNSVHLHYMRQVDAEHKNEMEKVHLRLFQRDEELRQLKLEHEEKISAMREKHETDLHNLKSEHDKEFKALKDQVLFFGRYTSLPTISLQSLDRLRKNLTVSIGLTIPDFTRKLCHSQSSNQYGEIFGVPFYTYHGYRMVLKVNLNEAPSGKAEYMGVYLYLLEGDHDDKVEWPFNKIVTFIIVDQQDDSEYVKNHQMKLYPDEEEQNEKPILLKSSSGVDCTQYVLHSILCKRQFLKDDTLFIALAIQP
ncbi:TNF receptor-associated factor 4-like [Dendronephthya gigantea]|uniref:TNF receptor-associated factor 4-like n=1 Tax=Dendronephthya gigantea TaxID=151771 RepID=UPI00106C6CB6|nr:TNF receptor-associated factor 4-like [Dendronephthya gigantea]